MATTTQTFTGTGSQTQFSIAFSYRTTADVKATINAVATTAFSVSGSTVTFNSAPANGAAVVIFRETTNDTIEADFQSGSALRAVDLNDNFEQLLFVTQESTNTANTADTNASAAVTTANTASSNATTAVNTANAATNTANSATATANSAVTTANSATATANAATTTANTASTNATAAVNTANTASSNATAAVNTANTASTNATAAVNTANTASSNATTAVNTANAATTTANAASAAVANAVLYDPVANVAAIPGSPSNNDYVEVQDSTGIQSFSPLSGMPSGFVGDSGLVVRLKYVTSPSTTWQWQNYFAKDSETRYLKDNAAQIVDADINASAAIGLSKLATGALPTAITVTSANISDLSIVNADVNASAAIAGTKISPNFGSQNVVTTGSGTFAGAITVDGGTTNENSSYGPGYLIQNRSQADRNLWTGQLNGSSTSTILADGTAYFASSVGIGTSSPSDTLELNGSTGYGLKITDSSSHIATYRTHSDGAILKTASNHALLFGTNDQERLRIDSSGRLLLGTTTEGAVNADTLTVAESGDSGITIRSGSANAGSLFFSDSTSGTAEYAGYLQYDHSSNELAVGTASTERLRIDSSGNVGIGTNSPTDHGSYGGTLEISGSPGGALYLKSSSDVGQLGMNSSGLQLRTRSAKDILFTTNNAERMRIDSSGNVFIGGTTAATADISLNANGNGLKVHSSSGAFGQLNGDGIYQMQTDGSTVGAQILANGSATFAGTVQATDGTQYVKAYETGFVQANRTNGANFVFEGRLSNSTTSSIKGDGSATFVSAVLANGTAASPSLRFTSQTNMGLFKTASGGLGFATAGSQRMEIDGSGRVGIGNTTMSSFTGNSSDNLVVGGGSGSEGITVYSAAQGSLTFADGTSGNAAYRGAVEYNHTADQLAFRTAGTGNRMVIDSSGNVAIGRNSASSELDIQAASGRTQITLRNVGNTSDASTFVAAEEMTSGNADLIMAARHNVRFFSNLNEKMRIDSSGRLGLGTSSPDDLLHLSGSTGYGVKVVDGTHTVVLRTFSGGGVLKTASNHALTFGTNDTERMRIKSDGNILIGKTTSGDTSAFGIEFYSGSTGGLHITNATSDAGSRVLAINRQSGNGEAIEFRRANTEVGSITVTTSATAYNTSSDYRLKENVNDITDGITRVKQLQPKRFNFIADAGTTVDGFLAHEAQTVVPEAVTGTHNEVDDDGNAVMQGIDQSKLVPLLTAALQEAIAKIETLEAKVAALEAA